MNFKIEEVKKKLITGMGLVTVVLLLMSGQALAADFADVQDHWGSESVAWGVSQGLIDGYTDGSFQPDNKLTAAEFSKLLAKFASNAYPSGIPGQHWSDSYYAEMQKFGLPFNGYKDKEIKDSPVTRGTIAQIIASKNGFDLPLPLAVQYMYDNGLSQGMVPGEQTFESYGADIPLTRAEAVAFLQRLDKSGMTRFLDMNSPSSNGRYMVLLSDKKNLSTLVTSKVRGWFNLNRNKIDSDNAKEIENWIKDKDKEAAKREEEAKKKAEEEEAKKKAEDEKAEDAQKLFYTFG